MKICTKCKTLKPLAEFSVRKASRDGLKFSCKECDKATFGKWAAANPEKNKTRLDEWREKNAEHVAEYSVAYYAARREQMVIKSREYRRDHPDLIRDFNRVYAINNKERLASYRREKRPESAKRTMARRCKLNSASPSWADPNAIRNKYLEATAISKATGVPHQVDHIVPLQGKTVCGLHHEHNLRVAPKVENLRKSNSFPEDGYREFFLADGSVIFEVGSARVTFSANDPYYGMLA